MINYVIFHFVKWFKLCLLLNYLTALHTILPRISYKNYEAMFSKLPVFYEKYHLDLGDCKSFKRLLTTYFKSKNRN